MRYNYDNGEGVDDVDWYDGEDDGDDRDADNNRDDTWGGNGVDGGMIMIMMIIVYVEPVGNNTYLDVHVHIWILLMMIVTTLLSL